jgi:hypothetical protein
VDELLGHDVVEHRGEVVGGERRVGEADDTREPPRLKDAAVLDGDLPERLPTHAHVTEREHVFAERPLDATRTELDLHLEVLTGAERGGEAAVVALVRGAGGGGAELGGDPEVRGAGVEDYVQELRRLLGWWGVGGAGGWYVGE